MIFGKLMMNYAN